MNRVQFIDFAARALYDAHKAEEDLRRAEQEAAMPVLPGGARRRMARLPDFFAQPEHEREVWRRRARPIVIALERAGLLRIGEERLFDVKIDDPDLEQPYTFSAISAPTPQAAAYEAARLAIRRDPLRFMASWKPPTMPLPLPPAVGPELLAIENPALVDAVAMYAYVAAHDEDGGMMDPEELWAGYC